MRKKKANPNLIDKSHIVIQQQGQKLSREKKRHQRTCKEF